LAATCVSYVPATAPVCLGDSLTHGILSANYLPYLAAEFGSKGYEFLNAGISGDLAYNVLQRLEEVIACKPDVVIVLCGANDAAAHLSDEWMKWYLRARHPAQRPTIEWYEAVLEQVVQRLQAETAATVALMELPLFTEDLHGPENARVMRYNEVVRQVGDRNGVPVIPLYAPMAALIPHGFTAPVFDGSRRAMGKAARDHWLLRRDWDSISRKNGFIVHTDHAHMNTRGARLIAAQIAGFLMRTGDL
jgi:lysophospholipase L1-like esterase